MNASVYELQDYPVRAWKIEANVSENENKDLLKESYIASMSFIAGTIFSNLNSKEIPHNLIFTDKGKHCYIIPRQLTDKDFGMNTSWLDLCGIPTIYSEELYQDTKQKGIQVIVDILRKEISLEQETFNVISNEILEKFKAKYVLN